MNEHAARVSWRRNGADFAGQRYSRGHRWDFDGGATVEASASPANVPAPYAVPEAVDPEEALVAAVASCHMLWFLSFAARGGFVVESYVDPAVGVIDKNDAGRFAFSRITLKPTIEFEGKPPAESELAEFHAQAHANCFIANSLRCEVIVA